MSENWTPGPWKAEPVSGWGDSICITAPDRDGFSERPIMKSIRPHSYYTDYPEYEDGNGERWVVCSTDAAIKAGNHVATPELRQEIEAQELADAHLAAAAPKMYMRLEACAANLRALGRLAEAELAESVLAEARGETP